MLTGAARASSAVAARAARLTSPRTTARVGELVAPPRAQFSRSAGATTALRASATSTTSPSAPSSSGAAASAPALQWPPTAEIAMLHDGDCPLCAREVAMLSARDATRGNKIFFVDVADPGYDRGPGAALGIPYEAAMRTIHGVTRDGTVLTGVAVFARLYELVGLGWVYGFMQVPALRAAAEGVYNAWAAARLPITGRPTLEAVLAERKTCKE